MRTVPEWIAKHDDEAIPDRVRDRVARRSDDCCVICKRSVRGKLRAEFDHIVPLILGGEHRERNLQLLCRECHGAKTKLDVKLKARIANSRKKRFGARKPSTLRSAGFPERPPQRSASKPITRHTY